MNFPCAFHRKTPHANITFIVNPIFGSLDCGFLNHNKLEATNSKREEEVIVENTVSSLRSKSLEFHCKNDEDKYNNPYFSSLGKNYSKAQM